MLFLAGSLLLMLAEAAPPAGEGSHGVWRNPSNSVHIRAVPCGQSMCGRIVWANDKAKADSARGGTKELIGLDLLRDFKRDKKGVWHGKAFVPDLNKTFSGTVTRIDDKQLKVSGCLMGRIGCKSQVWTRIE